MKKNVMMRVASIMLVLVLMSSSVISGTFAKYVTADSGSDTARVAKFGVVATVDGTLFAKNYFKAAANTPDDGTGDADSLSVISFGDANLVAPGTQNNTGMNFVLSGQPEVDVDVNFQFEVVDNKEVKLAAGTYTDNPTTGEVNDAFTLAADYYPVVFVLTNGTTELVRGNVATIQTWLDTNLNKVYNAGTSLADITAGGSTGYTLTWFWNFENTGLDAADTYLGNAAVGGTFPTDGATTQMEVKFTITVTQVD